MVVPCWSQQDAVTPPAEPASPVIEKVKDVDVDKTDAEKKTEKPVSEADTTENTEKPGKESTPVKEDTEVTGNADADKDSPPGKKSGEKTRQAKEVKTVDEKPASSSPPVKDDRGTVDESRLLSITDGPFKYRRISGIQLDDQTAESEPMMAADAESEPEVEKKNNQAGGLFGMDKETTDIVAWIILGLIILLVFILYRVRARERPGRVLRRFPRV